MMLTSFVLRKKDYSILLSKLFVSVIYVEVNFNLHLQKNFIA